MKVNISLGVNHQTLFFILESIYIIYYSLHKCWQWMFNFTMTSEFSFKILTDRSRIDKIHIRREILTQHHILTNLKNQSCRNISICEIYQHFSVFFPSSIAPFLGQDLIVSTLPLGARVKTTKNICRLISWTTLRLTRHRAGDDVWSIWEGRDRPSERGEWPSCYTRTKYCRVEQSAYPAQLTSYQG